MKVSRIQGLNDPPLPPSMQIARSVSSSSSSSSSSTNSLLPGADPEIEPTSRKPTAPSPVRKSKSIDTTQSPVPTQKRLRDQSRSPAEEVEVPQLVKRRLVIYTSSSSTSTSTHNQATHVSSPKEHVSITREPILLDSPSFEDQSIEKIHSPMDHSASTPASQTLEATIDRCVSQILNQPIADEVHPVETTPELDAQRPVVEGESNPCSREDVLDTFDVQFIPEVQSPRQLSIAAVKELSGIKTSGMPTSSAELGNPTAQIDPRSVGTQDLVIHQDFVSQLANDPSFKLGEARNPCIEEVFLPTGSSNTPSVPEEVLDTSTSSHSEERVVDDVVFTTEPQPKELTDDPSPSHAQFNTEELTTIKDDLRILTLKHEALAADVTEVKKTVADVQRDTSKILELIQVLTTASTPSAATPSAPTVTAETPTEETTTSLARQELLKEISKAVQVQTLKEIGGLQSKMLNVETTVRALFSDIQKEHILIRTHLKDIASVPPPNPLDVYADKKGEKQDVRISNEPPTISRSPSKVLKSPPRTSPPKTSSPKPAAAAASPIPSAQPTPAATKSKEVPAPKEIDAELLGAAKAMLLECGYKKPVLKKMTPIEIMEAAAKVQQQELEEASKLHEQALAEAKREKEASDMAKTESEKTSQVQSVDRFEDMPPDAEKKRRVKKLAKKPPRKSTQIKSIDELLKSSVMGIDTVEYVSSASTTATASGRKNIIDWEMDSSRDVIIITRANQSRTEIADPYVITKFVTNDIEDLAKIKLKNPNKVTKGIIAESILQVVLRKLESQKKMAEERAQQEQKKGIVLTSAQTTAKPQEPEIDCSLPEGDPHPAGTVIFQPVKGMYFSTTRGKQLKFFRIKDIPKVFSDVLVQLLKQVKDGPYSDMFKEKLNEEIKKKRVQGE